MAFLKPIANGRWELRESTATERGPRAKTLVTFSSLTERHIHLAVARSSRGLTAESAVAAARRAGAPVAASPADAAGVALLRAIGDGMRPSAGITRLLLDALPEHQPSAQTAEALEHIGKGPEQRGAELVDLLLLSDALPSDSR